MAPRKPKRARRRVAKSRTGAKRPRAKSRSGAGAAKKSRRTPGTRKPAARKPAAVKPAAARAPAPARVPSEIGLVNHHVDYTCHDMQGVRRFYTEILGFSQFNHDPAHDYLYVVTSPTSSLGFMPPMPGPPEDWRPPREPALYFIVQDVDRAHRALVDKGVSFDQAPTNMPWGHRVAHLRDPEGRRVCLAQPIKT